MKDIEVRIGIIILNYNTYEETCKCVDSIRKFTSLPYTIYIVDNLSPDGSYDFLVNAYQYATDVKLIQTNANKGYSAGNNAGVKKAENDGCNILFIINSDVELLNDAFLIMSDTLLRDESCMMIGPSVIDNHGDEGQFPREKLTYWKFVFGRFPFSDIPFIAKAVDRMYPVEENDITKFKGSVSGCCFGVRTSDFAQIGYFDEGVFLYYEEDILAYKMEKIGKYTVLDRTARVWHKFNVSTKQEGIAFVQFHKWISALYFLKKYVRINKFRQVFIALSNTLTWSVLSIMKAQHRKMCADFWKETWMIVKNKY